MQRPRRAKADAASLALARQLESEDPRPRRAAAKPRAKSPAKPRAKSPAKPKKPSSKRAAKQTTEPTRAALSCALFAVMAYANYMQHYLPQPVPRAWYDETGRDMGQHEIELRAYLGVWVYLTAQILLVLLVYHTLSVVAATTGKYEAQAHAAAPACLGLGLVVYGLFFFFYLLMRCCNPTWRDQWTYHESLGVPYERWMHLMHTPLWLCPLLDVLFVKKRDVLVRHVPSPGPVLATAGIYTGFYGALTSLNFAWTSAYVYPWLYDIDALGYGAFGHVAYYAALWVPVGGVLLACRRWVLKRGNAEFAVGAAVEARWEDGLWYPGRVSGGGSGGYEIAFDDGHTESGVRAAHVRSAAPARTAKKSAKKAATPARAKKEMPAVGDHVALALDDEEGIVQKVAGGWISVKLDDGTVEKFRSTELRY